MLTVRRVLITLLVVGGIAAVAVAFRSGDDGEGDGPTAEAVEQLIPGRNAETLSQTDVGVDLAAGWTGTLIVNGEEVRGDELRHVDALNQILYRPADGLESGRNCVRAVIWRSAESRDQAQNVDWCFEVT